MSEETSVEVVKVEHPHALEAVERAQIDMQIATAKKYPRIISKVKEDMMTLATLDAETASACFYTLPRGGKVIQRPSVRMAEIAVSSYGNVRVGSRAIQTVPDGPTPHVVVQGVAHDLEKNIQVTIEKRRRITKKRSKNRIDEDDINLAVNAGASIAFRDAVFKVVPQALIKPVWQAARKVAVGDVKSLENKRVIVIDRLKQMGTTEDRIVAAVGARKLEDVDQDRLEQLIGLGTAIKDGDLTLEEAFPAVLKESEAENGSKTAGLAKKLAGDKDPEQETEDDIPFEKTPPPEPPKEEKEAAAKGKKKPAAKKEKEPAAISEDRKKLLASIHRMARSKSVTYRRVCESMEIDPESDLSDETDETLLNLAAELKS